VSVGGGVDVSVGAGVSLGRGVEVSVGVAVGSSVGVKLGITARVGSSSVGSGAGWQAAAIIRINGKNQKRLIRQFST
jgi:transketolase N-terminal domain/subunit